MTEGETAADPIPLLKRLIACASVTPTEAGVLDALAEALHPLGFAITRLLFEGDGSYPVDNLFAIRERGGKRLLFAGHTDVVHPGERAAWAHDPFSGAETDGMIFGRGAADMKSGIAAFVAACEVAVKEGSADAGTIALAITNDEEADAINGTDKMMAWAHAQGYRWDFAIVGEPSSAVTLGDSIKIGRRGSFSGRVIVRGTQGHVAYPERANNPLPTLAKVVQALSGTPLDDGTPQFPPSNLEMTSIDVGNTTLNVIPAAGTMLFNIRYNDGWTPDGLTAWVEQRLADVAKEGCTIDFEVIGVPSRAFLSPLDGSVDLLCDVIAAETGGAPVLSTGGGTSDARFIAPYCPVAECGLVGTSMHKVDECVTIDDVRGLTRLYQAFIRRFLAA